MDSTPSNLRSPNFPRIRRCQLRICVTRPTRTIKSSGKSIPIAVVMLKANVDKMEAVRRLQQSDGNVRLAIDDSRLEL